ncbi:MAG: D-glycero-beta-D-manno-heptose 1,7-bisphosphate 7-phosphatase [Alcanivoracaceae bacterium]|nr:D-glycero-beta-D-manno-heptose 1,7-bisphosphate 7-phosphatase [Alcanivoracaceae bacterium]
MKLVILDRDGVINEDSDDFIKSPAEWIPLPGSAEAIAKLNDAGYKVVVATNQSGVGRGYFSLDTLDAIHEKMCAHIAAAGGELTGIFFCPHAPDEGCDCRKPKAGMIDQITARFSLNNADGVPIVGDSLRDLECGVARGCTPVLVTTGKGQRTLEKGIPESLGSVAVFATLENFVDAFLAAQQD